MQLLYNFQIYLNISIKIFQVVVLDGLVDLLDVQIYRVPLPLMYQKRTGFSYSFANRQPMQLL